MMLKMIILVSLVYFASSLKTYSQNDEDDDRTWTKDAYDQTILNTYEDVIGPGVSDTDEFQEESEKSSKKRVCTTKACQDLSNIISKNMNPSVDPCKDLFKYSCGGMPTSHSTFSNVAGRVMLALKAIVDGLNAEPPDKDSVDGKLVTWYNTCMDKNQREKLGSTPLKKLINSLGPWPSLTDDWDEESWDLEKAVAAMHRNGTIDALFSAGLSNNAHNVRSPLQPGLFKAKLGLEDVDFYVSKSPYQRRVLAAYFFLLYDLATLLGAKPGRRLAKDTFDVINIEFNLAMAMKMQKIIYVSYPYTTLGQLNVNSKGVFDWKKYHNLLYGGVLKKPFTDDDMVYLENPKYIESVLKVIDHYPKRAMANYLMSQVVRQFATALSSPFMNAYRSFWTEVYGLTKFSPPWLGCVRSTNKHLGSALGLHFVRRKFKDDALKQAENLIHDLTQAYLKHFKDDVTWMDSKTREAAMKKVLGMVEKVGYSKKIKDKKFLAKAYKDMEVNPLTYFDNIVKDYQAAVLYVLHSLGSVPTRSGFDMDITTQNAQYSPKQNTIEVAAGLFQPPLFHKDYPRAVTYGGIGMAAGHEMTHGFDTSGALFDEEGNARSWWTPSTFKKYLSKTMCFVQEYSNFTVFNGVYHLRGRQTLNENIADNGGLRIAYLAYENWIKENGNDFALPGKLSSLTSKQLFFISFSQLWCSKMPKSFTLNRVVSDVHTINKYRVIGTARNMKEFGEAFNCPLGSPMNPKKKCIEI